MGRLFSIIVPVYGVEKYIHQCVKSVLKQNYCNFELLLIDDGSPDRCPKICDEFAEIDERIRVIHKSNGGLSDARNEGIRQARGDYLLFLDGDDFWTERDMLERIKNRINKYKSDVVCLNFYKVYENGQPSSYFNLKKDMPEFYLGNSSIQFVLRNNLWIASAWNKVIKRELFQKGDLYFIKGITSEDIDWCARLAVIATSFDYIGKPFIGYRQRSGSISKTMSYSKVSCLKNNIEKIGSCIELARPGIKQLLLQYRAYQYGTLLKNVSLLEASSDRKELCDQLGILPLSITDSSLLKLRVLAVITKIFGSYRVVELMCFFEHIMKGH